MDLDFAEEGGFLYYISSVILFWENDEGSCLAVDLIPSRYVRMGANLYGTGEFNPSMITKPFDNPTATTTCKGNSDSRLVTDPNLGIDEAHWHFCGLFFKPCV